MSEPRSILALASPRPDLLAFEVCEKISEPDMRWMARCVEDGFRKHDRVDVLIIMTHFEGAEPGAIFDRVALRAMVRSNVHVRRYGVVGAPAWARLMIETFDTVAPVDAKTFDLDEEAAAWDWINRPEGP